MNVRATSFALLLIAAVAAGTAFILPQTQEERQTAAITAPLSATPVAQVNRAADAPLPGLAMVVARSDRSIASVAELTPESAAALAEQVTLRQLAHGTDLQLSDTHWAELAAIVARHQAIRHAHEANVATVISLPDGRQQVEVPAYGDFGELLRAQLFDEVAQRLGTDAADQVDAHLGDALEGYFAGFGISAQTLEFSNTPAPGDQLVTRTIAYSAPGDGDRLRTRREVHLPAAEDPSGIRWAPMLALLSQPRQG